MRNHPLRILSAALLIGSAVFLLLFGVVGKGRDGVANMDGRVLYAAGSTWLQRGNPYDHGALSRSVASIPGMDMSDAGFFYPPQAAAICVIMGLLPYHSARVSWLVVNLGALVALVIMTAGMLRRHAVDARDSTHAMGISLVTALIVGNPFTAHVVWMGQTTLVAIAALVGTWVFSSRKKHLAAGICLGLASYKPQLGILIVLWLILEKDWRTLSMSAVTVATMALWPMLTQGGPAGAFLAWRTGVNSDYALPFNLPTFSHKIGFQSLMVVMGGGSLEGGEIMAASVVLTILLWQFRRRFERDDVLSLLMIVTLTFSVYLHDYDYVALVPAFASLWRNAQSTRSAATAAVLLLLILFLPQRLVRESGIPFLEQWRTVVVMLIGAFIVYFGAGRNSPIRTDATRQYSK